VRRGASWTAAYHRQLTVAAVARPVRPGVGAPGVLTAARSWWLLAQTASAQRSVPPVSGGRASSPWSTLPAGTPRRRSRCPAGGVHPSGLGVRDPAVQPSGVRSPEVVVQRVRRSAVCCPPVRCPAVRCPAVRSPAVWCLPLSVRTRVGLLPCSGGGGGTRSRWPGDPDHQNRWRPLWLPSRRRLDRWSRRPGCGRRCRSRVGRWEVGGGPGRAGSGCGPRRPHVPLSDQPGPAGARSARRGRLRGGRGAGGSARMAAPDAWLASSAGGRPRWVVVAEAGAGWAVPEGPGEVPAGMGVRPQRGPGRQRARPARRRQRSELRRWLWACQDLNLGPHPYQGSAPGPVTAGSRLPPARTTYRWRPLETVANRLDPMGCGPNVDQPRAGGRSCCLPSPP
jgi:hypothetical protein